MLARARRRSQAGANHNDSDDSDDSVDAEVESDDEDGGYLPARAPGGSSRGSLANGHSSSGASGGVATARANANAVAAAAGLAPGSQAQYYAPPQQKPWAIVTTSPGTFMPSKPAEADVPAAKKESRKSVVL